MLASTGDSTVMIDGVPLSPRLAAVPCNSWNPKVG